MLNTTYTVQNACGTIKYGLCSLSWVIHYPISTDIVPLYVSCIKFIISYHNYTMGVGTFSNEKMWKGWNIYIKKCTALTLVFVWTLSNLKY